MILTLRRTSLVPSDVGHNVRVQFYDHDRVRRDVVGSLERIDAGLLFVRDHDSRLVTISADRVRFGKVVG